MKTNLLAVALSCLVLLGSSFPVRAEDAPPTAQDAADLLEQLKSNDPTARESAVRALSPKLPLSRDWNNPDVVTALINVAEKDQAATVRYAAVRAIEFSRGVVSKEEVKILYWNQPTVMTALINIAEKDQDAKVRYAAVQAIGHSKAMEDSPDAIKTFIGALDDQERDIRFLAAVFLGKANVQDARIIPFLIEALGGDYTFAAHSPQEAKFILMRMKQSPVKELTAAIGGDNPQVLWLGCEALGSRRKEAAEAVPALTKLLEHKDVRVRLASAGALGAVGPQAASALEPLRKIAAHDPSPAVQERAAESIERITVARTVD